MTIPAIIKCLQLKLNQLGCECQINREDRYSDRLSKSGMIMSRYKIIYWLPKINDGKKQKIEKEFYKQVEVLEELQRKIKEVEHKE